MHASIRCAAEFAGAERGPIGGAASSFLSGALGFAVRTISGEIVGKLVDVVPSTSTGGLEVVMVHGLPADAGVCRQSWCSAPTRLNESSSSTSEGPRSISSAPGRLPTRRLRGGNASTTRLRGTCSFFPPSADTTSWSGELLCRRRARPRSRSRATATASSRSAARRCPTIPGPACTWSPNLGGLRGRDPASYQRVELAAAE